MNEIIEILNSVKPGFNYETETALVDSGILDSLDIITIISEISDRYDITVSPDKITPENFNSAVAIQKMIEKIEEDN